MKKDTLMLILVSVGLLLIAAGIVIPLLTGTIASDVFRYVFAAGALMLLIGRLFSPYKGSNRRIKRLTRIEVWAALFFCAAAFLMFYDTRNLRDPLAFVLAGGVIQIFTSIMIPRLMAKDKNPESDKPSGR